MNALISRLLAEMTRDSNCQPRIHLRLDGRWQVQVWYLEGRARHSKWSMDETIQGAIARAVKRTPAWDRHMRSIKDS